MRYSASRLGPVLLVNALALGAFAQQLAPMRPPAVPLVAHDPYFSIWSMADRLNDEGTRHWTGKPNGITAFVRIDGKPYQVIGRERGGGALLHQVRLEVLPTRSIYSFSDRLPLEIIRGVENPSSL